MSASLKEKASQGCYHCSCCSHYHGIKKGCDLPKCAFVPRKLLEDAQKEIDKREKDQNDAYEQLLKLFLKLGNEHSEFKQKLQCWYKQEAWFHLPLEVREHFWELLKEKEVKTT